MIKTAFLFIFVLAICSNCTNSHKSIPEKATSEDYKVINATFYHLVQDMNDTINWEFGYTNFIKSFKNIPERFILKTYVENVLLVDSTLTENEILKISNGNIHLRKKDLQNLKAVELNTKYIMNVGYRRIYPIKTASGRENSLEIGNEKITFSRIFYNKTKDKAFFQVKYVFCGISRFVKAVYVEKINGLWEIKNEVFINNWIA